MFDRLSATPNVQKSNGLLSMPALDDCRGLNRHSNISLPTGTSPSAHLWLTSTVEASFALVTKRMPPLTPSHSRSPAATAPTSSSTTAGSWRTTSVSALPTPIKSILCSPLPAHLPARMAKIPASRSSRFGAPRTFTRCWEWKFVPKDMPYSERSMHKALDLRFAPYLARKPQLARNMVVRCDRVLVMGKDRKECERLTMAAVWMITTRPWRLEVDPWKSWFGVGLDLLEGLDEKWWTC
ncbi:hypothetical protein IWZ01DRAFT_122870 [Phyllosticta capitalensis]